MKTHKQTGAPQFSNRDLSQCGKHHYTTSGVSTCVVTVDDLNLWLRGYCWNQKLKKLRRKPKDPSK